MIYREIIVTTLNDLQRNNSCHTEWSTWNGLFKNKGYNLCHPATLLILSLKALSKRTKSRSRLAQSYFFLNNTIYYRYYYKSEHN